MMQDGPTGEVVTLPTGERMEVWSYVAHGRGGFMTRSKQAWLAYYRRHGEGRVLPMRYGRRGVIDGILCTRWL